MVEPVTITRLTLSGISIFSTTVNGCITAYKAYKLSASFGEDWVAAERRFSIQHAKLKTLSRAPISWFVDDFYNEQDELTIAVKTQLVDIENCFMKCRELMKKYHDIERKLKEEEAYVRTQMELQEKDRNSQTGFNANSERHGKGRRSKKSTSFQRLVFWKPSDRIMRKKKDTAVSKPETASLASGSTAVNSTQSAENHNGIPPLSSTQRQVQETNEPRHSTAGTGTEEAPDFLTEEFNKTASQAKQRQSALGLYNRLRWVDHDRDELYKQIKSIEKGNNQLESLLRIQSILDPALILGTVDNEELSQRMINIKNIQTGLRRLHVALARSNQPKGDTGNEICFSIQVHEEPDKLAEDLLESSESLPITIGKSWIFALHGHLEGVPESPSVLLYAETKMNANSEFASEEGINVPLASIHTKIVNLASNHDHQKYKVLGPVVPSDGTRDSHLLINHTHSEWGSPQSLKVLLADEQYQTQLKATERLQFAHLMIVGFIYLKEVMRATEQYPRPEKILFYTPAGQSDAEARINDEIEPEILNPYLSIGLGRKKQGTRRPVGATSGRTKRFINPVAELSLVLFQVATGMTLNYGIGDTGFREAVSEARSNMHKLDEQCGPLVTEVVQLCLDRSTGKDLFKPAWDGDYRFMERLRMWYQKKEEMVH